jgi:dCMP deaminase
MGIKNLMYLKAAGEYAKSYSGCTKVSVGSCILTVGGVVIFGANKVIKNHCKSEGCLRIAKYGDNAKTHRNPDDCLAIHSEIDAICQAAKEGISLEGATIFVTRYPCEACARAIAAAGIKNVVYGRNQKISEMTKRIFDDEGIFCYNEEGYMEDDTVV